MSTTLRDSWLCPCHASAAVTCTDTAQVWFPSVGRVAQGEVLNIADIQRRPYIENPPVHVAQSAHRDDGKIMHLIGQRVSPMSPMQNPELPKTPTLRKLKRPKQCPWCVRISRESCPAVLCPLSGRAWRHRIWRIRACWSMFT